MQLTAVILAAGQGTRMKSSIPKVLHPLGGRPLVLYSVETARAVTGTAPVLVVGHGADAVRGAVAERARYAVQAQQLGTGHAVLTARDVVQQSGADAVLVSYADMPLLTEETLRALAESHARSGCVMTLLTVIADDPRGFGRVVRDAEGNVQGVVEEVVATPEQLMIRELNAGVYCFDAEWLWRNLPVIPVSPKGEYFLPDLAAMALAQGCSINAVRCEDETELLGINTRVHLAEAEAALRQRINRGWMEAGVTMLDPATTYVEPGVTIGPDTVILPNTYLMGATRIGAGCRIGPSSIVQDCDVGDRCIILQSVLEEAVMEPDSNIGPFSHLRKGARVCRGAHVGNFGEMKNSTLGPGSKMGHFSYLGDAQIGEDVNIGAGTITCNFDGVRKHKTVIEDGAFIGSDSMLVAPLRIGRGAKTGAGSVVTHDVPAGAVAYGVPARVRTTPAEAPSNLAKPDGRGE
jgi:bifunctional UDP-N-acetylglucosamine pyrophosphorylase/glucosamine-1-phosphate N-acetyltransferase